VTPTTPSPARPPAYTIVAIAVVVVAILGGLYVARGHGPVVEPRCNLPSSVVNAVIHGEPGTFEVCTSSRQSEPTDTSPPITCPDGSPPITGALCAEDYEGVPGEELPPEATTPTTVDGWQRGALNGEPYMTTCTEPGGPAEQACLETEAAVIERDGWAFDANGNYLKDDPAWLAAQLPPECQPGD
jgi:hypothetical protein